MADSSQLTLQIYPLRFFLEAVAEIRFPQATAGNRIRGALGQALRAVACEKDCPGFAGRPSADCTNARNCVYARLFEPVHTHNGPAGLDSPPRPFILRAAHLNGGRFNPPDRFHFDLHWFDVRSPAEQMIPVLLQAVAAMAGHGGMLLVSGARIDAPGQPLLSSPLSLSLEATPEPCSRIQIQFLTPLELKSGGQIADLPEFGILFRRIHARIANLRAFYGNRALAMDNPCIPGDASLIHLARHSLRYVEQTRRSSRTGQIHGLNGWIGSAEYEGDLSPFLPWLRAAEWTGAGRQTVWGKGQIAVTTLD